MSDFVIEVAEKLEKENPVSDLVIEDWLDFVTNHYDFDFWFQYLMN